MHLQKHDYRRSPGTIDSHSMYGKNLLTRTILVSYFRTFELCQKVEKAYLMYIQLYSLLRACIELCFIQKRTI